MEEDAGKLLHDAWNRGTFMDFNRCGVPLLEIVSQPDLRSGGEAVEFIKRLRETLLYLGICDCKMEEVSLRADVNLSVRRPGGGLGVRTEMKNLNSLKAIGRAVEAETLRQTGILEDGGHIIQETRRWDDDKGESFAMRSKENARDYRYFPEPDLLPVEIGAAWLESIRASLPELAPQKRERYVRQYGLSEYAASVLTCHKNVSDLFEEITRISRNPLEAANLVTGEIMRLMNSSGTQPENLRVDGGKLSRLISLVSEGKINRSAYKEAVGAVFTDGADPENYIAEKGLMMVSDGGAVSGIVVEVLRDNADAVAGYRAGRGKTFEFLTGQVMRRLGGAGNPAVVREAVRKALEDC